MVFEELGDWAARRPDLNIMFVIINRFCVSFGRSLEHLYHICFRKQDLSFKMIENRPLILSHPSVTYVSDVVIDKKALKV